MHDAHIGLTRINLIARYSTRVYAAVSIRLLAAKSEGVWLIARTISFQDFQPM